MYGEMSRTGKTEIIPDPKQLISTKTPVLIQSSGLKPKTQSPNLSKMTHTCAWRTDRVPQVTPP